MSSRRSATGSTSSSTGSSRSASSSARRSRTLRRWARVARSRRGATGARSSDLRPPCGAGSWRVWFPSARTDPDRTASAPRPPAGRPGIPLTAVVCPPRGTATWSEVNAPASALRLPRAVAENVKARLVSIIGGPARTRVVLAFACVLALESADLAAVGATAPQLEKALHLSNTQIGLLAAISTFVGAVATLPVGAVTDRLRRVPILAGAIALWAVAMIASATAQSYTWLLLSRVGLGAVTAAAGPLVASLTGDYFAASERGRIYGY